MLQKEIKKSGFAFKKSALTLVSQRRNCFIQLIANYSFAASFL